MVAAQGIGLNEDDAARAATRALPTRRPTCAARPRDRVRTTGAPQKPSVPATGDDSAQASVSVCPRYSTSRLASAPSDAAW